MSSGVFKWSSDSRYFNPMCDEQLYFDTYNSGTEPKFCEQETCLLPVFTPTGVPVPCDQVLKPSGYTNRIFKWGIKNASWTLDANYDGFVRDDYAFVQPFQITESEDAIDNCMVKGVLAWNNGYGIGYLVNSNTFNKRLKTVYATPDGFTPMEGKELDGMTIDPSVVGAKILKPASYGPYLCADNNTYIEPPEIEYFTVGTDQVPSSNIVTLKDAPITPNRILVTPPLLDGGTSYGYFHVTYVPGYERQTGVICFEGSQPVTVDTGLYQTDRNNLTTYRQNPYNYNPSIGATSNNIVQFSWVKPISASSGTTFSVSNNSNVIITGYRIQKYVQKMHSVYFSDGKPQVKTGVRHLETKVQSLGYTITWEFVSATINKYVSNNYIITSGKYNFGFVAKGDVQLRMTYEPYVGNINNMPFEEYGPYVTATNRCSPITTTSTQYRGYLYNPPANQYNICLLANQYGDLPLYRSDGAKDYGLLTTRSSLVYSPRYGQYTQNYWDFYESALGSGMSSFSTSNPLSPKSQSSIANYEFPLNRQVSNFNLVTVVNGVNVNPQPPQSNQPTRDGKLWRTLSGAINPVSNSTIDISFSNRAEWFNPTCPFELIYDQYESNEDWHPNGCHSTIKPIILSTG